jgi:hypothetical protein
VIDWAAFAQKYRRLTPEHKRLVVQVIEAFEAAPRRGGDDEHEADTADSEAADASPESDSDATADAPSAEAGRGEASTCS